MKEEFCFEVGHGVWHLEACDLKTSAQTVLCSLTLDHGCGDIRTIKHVRGDMLGLIDEMVSRELRSLFPSRHKRKLDADQEEIDRQLCIAEALLSEEACYPCGRKAECMQCTEGECVVYRRSGSSEKHSEAEAEDVEEHLPYDRCEVDLFIAGFTCKDWSSRGKNLGCGGDSFLPFLTMIFELRAKKYKVAILECTKNQPDALITYFLADIYYIDSTVLCPTDFGWPIERPRKWPQ